MRQATGRGRAIAVVVVVGLVVLAAVAATAPGGPTASSAPVLSAITGPSPLPVAASAAASTAPSGVASPAQASKKPAATTPATPRTGRVAGLPDPALTPGALNPAVTPATIKRTICATGWTATIRPPSSYTTALKRAQIAQYGYTDTALRDYEEDHLVSLELGGAPSDPRNLWPEPYRATLPDGTAVGARVKDKLENRLNDLVCGGAMPLATAQHLIATDWLGAWRQFVAP